MPSSLGCLKITSFRAVMPPAGVRRLVELKSIDQRLPQQLEISFGETGLCGKEGMTNPWARYTA